MKLFYVKVFKHWIHPWKWNCKERNELRSTKYSLYIITVIRLGSMEFEGDVSVTGEINKTGRVLIT